MMNHLVSVITPCFNSGPELEETILSVKRQTYTNYEHIIVDDYSAKPLSHTLLSIIESDPKITLIRRTWNAGAAVTRNRGISQSKGEFIAFLDADDVWHPQKLEKQIDFMLNRKLALSYTSYEVFDVKGRILGVRRPPSSLHYEDVLKSNQIGCLTAIYSVDILGKMYMPNIPKRQDMGLWLKILKSGVIAEGLVDKPLARYRVGGTSLSSNKLKVIGYQWKIYRDVEKLSILKSAKCFGYYAYRSITRKI